MYTYDYIKKLILSRKNDLDENTLYYFTNYFYVLVSRGLIPRGRSVESLIDNVLYYAREVVFYDENDDVYKRLGPDAKGLSDPETKKIYIRKNLEEPLREMVIYHEIHHAAQTNKRDNAIGINPEYAFGRLIVEGQTQWFAEEVYKTIHNTSFDEKEIPSDKLRMAAGGTVVSALHNYELFDCMLTKLAIFLDVDKDFFVLINFMNHDNRGIKYLEDIYEARCDELGLEIPFINILYYLDYIFAVDYQGYVDNPNKEIVLSGGETKEAYFIHNNPHPERLSFKRQKDYIDIFDKELLISLYQDGDKFNEFSKYVIDNGNRKILEENYSNQKKV